MKELKPPLTFDQQLELLKSRNLIIKDDNEVLSFLKSNNYYRFSGYTFLFQNEENHFENVSFDDIKYIYDFDSKLRQLLLKYLETIEIACRTSIAYYFSNYYNDSGAHYNCSYFKSEKHHTDFLKKHYSYIEDNRNLLFVEKHIKEYSDLSCSEILDNIEFKKYRMPIWVAVELMPIGMLSRFYKNIASEEILSSISKSLNSNSKCFDNWLYVLSTLRNKCAHYDRLYRIDIKPYVKFSNYAKSSLFENLSDDKLFRAIVIIGKMLSSELCENFIRELAALFNIYFNIDISNIGFPSNWQEIILQYRKYNY